MKSWKTTSAGILMIASALTDVGWAIIHKTITQAEIMADITAVVGGIGLMLARDNDKSSEDVGAKLAQQEQTEITEK